MSVQILNAALERCIAKQMSIREIASAFGCSTEAVARRRKSLGYTERARRMAPLLRAVLAAIRDGARTTEEIGERVGRSRAAVAVMTTRLAQRGDIKQIGTAPAGNGGRHASIWAVAS